MKDKEKQIEEIMNTIDDCSWVTDEDYCDGMCERCRAKRLYEQGYRKLPEDSVVLSREEYQKNILTANSDGYGAGKIDGSKEMAEKILKDLKLLVPDNALGIVTRYFKEIIGLQIKE